MRWLGIEREMRRAKLGLLVVGVVYALLGWVIYLLLADPAAATVRSDARAATGVTFVDAAEFNIGSQAGVQMISCPKDPLTPPGGPCENLFSQSGSDDEVDTHKEPDGCTPGTDCYDTDGEPNPWTTPAGDVVADPDRTSMTCSSIMHPIETWEALIEYVEGAPPGYPLDEVYAFCNITRAWQGLAGRTYRAWVNTLTTWEDTTVRLTMTCGSVVKTWDSTVGGALPQIALASDQVCTLQLDTVDHVLVEYPSDPQRSVTMMQHSRAGANHGQTPQQGGGCGLGIELAVLLPFLRGLRKR